LSDFCILDNAFTVSEAYEVIEHLKDARDFCPQEHFKFINTGTIDPFVTLWGHKQTTYIKKKYLKPIITKRDFQRAFSKRVEIARSPKIVISGMRHFEAYYDEYGECVAGKSTVIVRPRTSNTHPYFVLGILNSQLMKFFLRECYGSLAMDGGISFTTTNTSQIPFPAAPNPRNVDKVIRIVRDILIATKGSPNKDISHLQAQVDIEVYALYGLTREEIKIVAEPSGRR
jgi:hypothetical protein